MKKTPEYYRQYYRKHREAIRANARRRYQANPLPVREQSKKWAAGNPERRRLNLQRWKSEHPLPKSKQQEYSKRYYSKHKERVRNGWARWRDANHYDFLEYRRFYKLAMSKESKQKERERNSRRGRDSLNLRLRRNLSGRLTHILRGSRKSAPFLNLLGCSVEDFKIYIESKFDVGMSWDNWGKGCDKWNLDHIVPCALFDLTKSEHQKRCFHFSNYQPMWQPDNARKYSKSDNQFRLL